MAERQSPDGPAAGTAALISTLRHARAQTGLVHGARVLLRANQRMGFDCPGCAWPDPTHRSPFEFCENGAKAILDEATSARVTPEFFQRFSVEELRKQSEKWLGQKGRLTTPMIRRNGGSHFEPISVEEALSLVASELSGLDDPNQAAFYTSGRASNEAAYAFQLLARRLGTNNLPDCSNLCHESSGVALKASLGIGKATVRLSDFNQADLIFVIGQNPGSNHPRMLSTLREARAAGALIVSINPLMEAGLRRFAHPQSPSDMIEGGSPLADRFVRVSVGGDQALFRGLCKALLEESSHLAERTGLDRDFISKKTAGFVDFQKEVQATSWQQIEGLSGIAHEEISALAQLVREARGVICTWAMGVTQHVHAVDTISEIVNLLLLGGHLGRPGSGVCPVRGHSNVQGDRTVGIATSLEPSRRKLLEEEFGFAVPTATGLDSIGTVEALRDGRVSHFLSLGGNFLSACPDTDVVRRGLAKTKLNVQIATKVNHSHLYGERLTILLPCLGRTDRDEVGGVSQVVSVEDTMGVVHASKGRSPPPSPECWSEPRLVSKLGELIEAGLTSTGTASGRGRSAIPWARMQEGHRVIRALIERTVPGFGSYEQRLASPEGFELPNGPRDGIFTTKSGRANFRFGPLSRLVPEEDELILTSVRSHDQFNTTVYSDDDRYRGIFGTRRVLLVAPEELERRGLSSGDAVWIESRLEDERRKLEGFVVIAYDVPPATAIGYFPEVNPLFFLAGFARQSRTPTSKAVRIVIGRKDASEPART